MNWVDLIVLGIIIGFGIIGMVNGFILSVFRLASFFISAIVAVNLYPLVSKILVKTALYDNIWNRIYKGLLLQQQTQTPKIDGEVKKAAADTVVNGLHLPSFLKGSIIESIPSPSKLIDLESLARMLSDKLAGIVMDVISLVLLYIAIRIGLVFLKVVLQEIAKLPLFKQVNQLGGFAFGAVEGVLTIYIVCIVIMLFQANPQFEGIYQAIDSSVIAKYFYQNNIIVNLMFPK